MRLYTFRAMPSPSPRTGLLVHVIEDDEDIRAETVFALGELGFDKLPTAPDRTEIAGLVARLLLGGLAGAAVAVAAGAVLALGGWRGAAGGAIGAFGG